MTEKALKLDFAHQLHALCPIVDTLRLMFGAARHAFNRSSKAELEELAKLQDTFTLDTSQPVALCVHTTQLAAAP